MRLGIFGGSFNPIHVAHLVIATRAAEAVHLDRVLFVPTGRTPLKDPGELAPARDRLEMVRRAVRGNPLFAASDLELRRGGTSYTIDTLREVRRRTGAELFVILGADAANLLPRWREAEAVQKAATFVLIRRPGHRLRSRMPKQYQVVDCPLLDISSTEIRERARAGRSIRYLVPDGVERYIRRKGLYR